MRSEFTPYEVASYYRVRLPDLKQKGAQWRGPCPIHNGKDDNFAVEPETGKWYCHSLCGRGGSMVDLEMALCGGEFRTAVAEVERIVGRPPVVLVKPQITATYDYQDEDGQLVYQVVRLDPKAFRQRRPDGKGGWVWNLKGVERVLYRLPRLKEAGTVFVVEGEKDVENLERLGFEATCNSEGAGKWRSSFGGMLAGKRIVVVPDNDEPGRKHADDVVRSLRGKALEVVVLPVPQGKDVSDWIAAGATRETIEAAVVAAAPAASAADGEPDGIAEATGEIGAEEVGTAVTGSVRDEAGPEELPEILTNNRQMRDISGDCIQALLKRNCPPRLFVRNGGLVELRSTETGRPVITDLTDIQTRGILAQAASYFAVTKQGVKPCPPPLFIAQDILGSADLVHLFPGIVGITEVPVLRSDGTVLTEAGYDRDSNLYYAPDPRLVIPSIPKNPAHEDIRAALDTIDSAIGDFPFVHELDGDLQYVLPERRDFVATPYSASRANAIATLLTPLVRPAISGPTPLALVDAPAPGTGKTLFTEVIAIITTGRDASLFSAPDDEEEWRKQITSYLREGVGVVVMDNVTQRLESAQLCKALTATVWGDRILGHSRTALLPVRCLWLATGNNIAVAGDLPRRCYWIRMDARTSAPHLRSGFRHLNLRRWVMENRGQLIAALLTLARAWFAAGKPEGKAPRLGSYESWCETIGGILHHAGVPGLLANPIERETQDESEEDESRLFLLSVRDIVGDKRFSSADIEALYRNQQFPAEALPASLVGALSEPGLFARRLGRWFAERTDRRFGDGQMHVVRAGANHKVQLWKIVHPGGEVSECIQ